MKNAAQSYEEFKQAYGRVKRQPRCAGCGQTFESYGMTADEGFRAGGLVYCNSDCHLESGVADQEREEWDALSEEYWEGNGPLRRAFVLSGYGKGGMPMLYLVHKHTKEHRRYADALDWPDADCMVVGGDPDGWIEWQEGSGNPLPEDTRCDVMLWGRKVAPNVIAHSNSSWEGVTHYRPIHGADEPEAPEWDGEGLPPVGCECEVEYAELGNWIRAKVIGYDGPACVVAIDGHGYFGSRNPSEFRPILDAKVSHPGTLAGPDKYRAAGDEWPAWDGEGDKPPVGSRCMKDHAEVLVIAHANVGSLYDPAVVYQPINHPMGIDWKVSNVFSPIRSEEDRAVEEMVAIDPVGFTNRDSAVVRDFARELYRAGYRKTGDT